MRWFLYGMLWRIEQTIGMAWYGMACYMHVVAYYVVAYYGIISMHDLLIDIHFLKLSFNGLLLIFTFVI